MGPSQKMYPNQRCVILIYIKLHVMNTEQNKKKKCEIGRGLRFITRVCFYRKWVGSF